MLLKNHFTSCQVMYLKGHEPTTTLTDLMAILKKAQQDLLAVMLNIAMNKMTNKTKQ